MPDDNVIADPASLLADSFYGTPSSEDPTQSTDEPKPEDSNAEGLLGDENPTPDDVGEGGENSAAAGDSETVDNPDDQVEEVELATFEQLAEHLETDADFLEGLTITQKVNGEPVEVKLADALQTHRQVVAGDKFLAEAKEKSKAIIAEARSQQESIGETAAVAATLIQTLEKEFEADVAGVDWAQLRKDDPGAAALKAQDVDQRRSKLQTLKQNASAKYREHVAQVAEAQRKANLARIPEEHEKLISIIPEWADDKKANAEQKEVVQYMQDSGFSEEQIQAASFNSTFLSVLIKAKRYDSAKGKSEAIKKKVITVPKTIKSGTKTDEPSKPKADSTDRVSTLYG